MIRKALPSDKPIILKFCKHTFSWGDYIEEIWDYWMNEGILLVIQKQIPVGMTHGVFFKNQVWIEGIRIDPRFRRHGLASKLIQKIELMAKEKKISFSYMLIDSNNKPSLSMAKILNYKIFQSWNFYTLAPKKTNGYISGGNVILENQFTHYVKSWRWIPLDKKQLDFLASKNKIIYSGDDERTIAILEDSEHFKNTLIVTIFAGSQNYTKNLISYLQNFGKENNYQRLQILTRENLPNVKGLDLKISFHLMQKVLS